MYIRAALIVSLLTIAVTVGCSRKPKSDKEQASYTIGAQFGKSLRAQDLDLDMKALLNGLQDGYKGDKMELNEDQMQGSMMKLSEERQKVVAAEAAKNKVAADAFLEKNKNAEGVHVTKSGLQYKITQEGSGASPKLDDTVVVNYKGTLTDGTEFDSSYKRNMPAEFPVRGVIPGWTEGLQLMKKGGKATFYIPPDLAYGDRPRQKIPPNSVLIFDVELQDIKPGGVGALHTPPSRPMPAAKAGKRKH